jgi:hypothetical protein
LSAGGAQALCGLGSDGFDRSRARLGELVGFLGGEQGLALTHGELEEFLLGDGRELLRQLYQDSIDLRAVREQRLEVVVGARGAARTRVEQGHERALETVFGQVQVQRLAYRAPGESNLHPQDAVLNLPEERHSHGMRKLAAFELSRGSFEDAQQSIERQTGQLLGKRQLRELAVRAACDFESFYEQRKRSAVEEDAVLVLFCDGKGVVMRQEALRPQTQKQVEEAKHKLQTRLSRGEKRGRKWMAEVAAVYEIKPVVRTAGDILPVTDEERQAARAGPHAQNKWLTANLSEDAATVVHRMFDEAQRRDREHERTWIVLVDGSNHPIERIKKEARKRKVKVTILIDSVHVLEYIWRAAWSFFEEGDPAAERWVREKFRQVLEGKAGIVAAAIKRKATTLRLNGKQRQSADTCATYLLNERAYLDYPTALANGWPIATGVIEGACRHLVKDRMDITGARWGLDSAEAVLKLRALISNGQPDEYWRYHLQQERRQVHESRYPHDTIPAVQ